MSAVINILGHNISAQEIATVSAVEPWPIPKNENMQDFVAYHGIPFTVCTDHGHKFES